MRMTNVQTIKDYNLTPNVGVQSNKLVDQSSALTIKAIDLQKLTDKMKEYMEGSNEKSIIGILGLIKNLLPEGIQLDRINQLNYSKTRTVML